MGKGRRIYGGEESTFMVLDMRHMTELQTTTGEAARVVHLATEEETCLPMNRNMNMGMEIAGKVRQVS